MGPFPKTQAFMPVAKVLAEIGETIQMLTNAELSDEEVEQQILGLGDVIGQQLLADYRQWRNIASTNTLPVQETNVLPFLQDVDQEALVNVVNEVLQNEDLTEYDRDSCLKGILNQEQYEKYFHWRSDVCSNDFLQMLTPGIAQMARTKLKAKDFDTVELLVKANPTAHERFLHWKEMFLEKRTTETKHAETTDLPIESKTINILVLGESGVGKSTLINSIANYAFHETLAEARHNPLNIFIRSHVEMYDNLGSVYDMTIEPTVPGSDEESGIQAKGSSVTQRPSSYILEYRNGQTVQKIRIIDTPGVLDTNGPEKDSQNMNLILNYLGNFKEIHGILVLMKPNEDKLNIPIKYCFRQLMTRLHVDAAKNILFCFTRGASTHLRPGSTRQSLGKLLEEMERDHVVQIPLTEDVMYTYENNCLHTLCALKSGKSLDEHLLEQSAENWEHSAKETRRLFQKIMTLSPHNMEQTLRINNVREIVNSLARPMAQMAREQLMNRRTIISKLDEIDRFKEEIESLRGRLSVSQVALRAVELKEPQTVCTSPICTTYESIGENPDSDKWPIHKKVCHANCTLSGVQEEVRPNPALKNCVIFIEFGLEECAICGCDWAHHQHVRYAIEPYETMVIDKNIALKAENNEQLQFAAQEMVKELREKELELQKNSDQIARVGADFASFLKKYSIMKHNDAYLEYLNKAIDDEEMKILYNGGNTGLGSELRRFRDEYEQVVKLVTSPHAEDAAVHVEDIERLIQELKDNSQYGHFIRQALQLEIDGVRASAEAEEKIITSDHPFTFQKL